MTITLVTNGAVFYLVHFFVTNISPVDSGSILSAGTTLLGISTATLVFFGDYVQKTTNWLFEKREVLVEFKDAVPKMGKVFLKLIFLQLLLLWTVIATGAASLLSALNIFVLSFTITAICSLALLLGGVVTVIIWMCLFVLANTPGRSTYKALISTS
jgi:hypothetical protein